MDGQAADFLLALAAQLGADGIEQLHHHAVHQVVALNVEVRRVRRQAERRQFPAEGVDVFDVLRITGAQFGELGVDAAAHVVQAAVGMLQTDFLQADEPVEVVHGERRIVVAAVEPDVPQEKRIGQARIAAHELREVQQLAVVQRGLHTDVVQGLGAAQVVLDGVGVGLQDVRVPVDVARQGGGALHQEVVVAVHAGNEAAAQLVGVERVEQHGLLSFRQGGLRGEHHLKAAFVGLELGEQRAPEGHVVVAFDVGHDAAALLRRRQAAGSVEVVGGEVMEEGERHLSTDYSGRETEAERP